MPPDNRALRAAAAEPLHGASLGLDAFILETMRVPQSEMTLDRLESLFSRLDLPARVLDAHARTAAGDYCRTLLCRTPRFDMLVIGWRKGQFSSIHDHMGTLNCTRVIRGTLTQRLFRAEGAGESVDLELVEEERLPAGARTLLDAGGIHQMGNADDADLLTLHVYSAPLSEITVYEPERRATRRVQMRYSLEDDLSVP